LWKGNRLVNWEVFGAQPGCGEIFHVSILACPLESSIEHY
jgi:hypothetical protein